MGLSKEMFRPKETGADFSNANLGSSERKVSQPFDKLRAGSARSESRMPELLSLILGDKDKAERTEEPKLKRADGFEPFVNPQPSEDTLFVNGYNGNFAQKMDLNRKGVERILKIAHLDGQVFLTTLSPNRQKSIEANPDGSVSGKQFLLFEAKAGEDEKDSPIPLSRVAAVPQGWRIEINDQKLTEELTEKKLGGKELQRTFINMFNGKLKDALRECVWREKFTNEKHNKLKDKLFLTVTSCGGQILGGIAVAINLTPFTYGVFLFALIVGLSSSYIANHTSLKRSTDNILETFLPPLEFDRVGITFAYISIKGRTLVRQTREEK